MVFFLVYKMINIFILLFIALPLSAKCDLPTLYTFINPNCSQFPKSCFPESSNYSATNLVYSKLVDNKTQINFIWSTVGNYPGFLIYQTNPTSSNVSINWDNLMNDSCVDIDFYSSSLFDSLALVIERIYFQSDNLSQRYPIQFLNLSNFIWQGVNNQFNCDTNHCFIDFIAKENKKSHAGTISIKVKVSNKVLRDEFLPQLLYDSQSALIELRLENFTTFVNQSRPIVQLRLFSLSDSIKLIEKANINDEYSPGMFESKTLFFYASNISKAYVYWKPIVYTSKERIIAKSMNVVNSKVKENFNFKHLNKLVKCFYQDKNLQIYSLNLTFGVNDDSYYPDFSDQTAPRMVSFSLTFGLGDLPKSAMSLALFIVIYVGFGVPLILAIFGLIYVGIIYFTGSLTQREPITQNV